jgi:hypothetical protein
VTKLDVLDTLDRLGVCVGYEIDGEVHEEFPGDLAKLDCVKPKYEWFDGWKRSTADARALSICRARRGGISTGSSARRSADHVRERRDAARSDHRVVAVIIGAADSGMHDVDLLIVGAGPCGLAAAISASARDCARACSTRAPSSARSRSIPTT